jgi:hypothetical protein
MRGKVDSYDLFVSMKLVYDSLKYCRSFTSKLFIVPYDNPAFLQLYFVSEHYGL